MSAAAYQRGSNKISRDIDAELDNPGLRARLDATAVFAQLENTKASRDRLACELLNLRQTIAAERAASAVRIADLQHDLDAEQKNKAYWHDRAMEWFARLQRIEAKHQKLSQIVRTAISPDDYREMSDDFNRWYPDHPAAKVQQ